MEPVPNRDGFFVIRRTETFGPYPRADGQVKKTSWGESQMAVEINWETRVKRWRSEGN